METGPSTEVADPFPNMVATLLTICLLLGLNWLILVNFFEISLDEESENTYN